MQGVSTLDGGGTASSSADASGDAYLPLALARQEAVAAALKEQNARLSEELRSALEV